MEAIFQALNNAYILFSVILGVYAAVLAGRNEGISGNFWGTLWTNTMLAAMILIVAIVLTLMGKRPVGIDPDNTDNIIKRDVYYLYAIYFVISLPGASSLMGGNNDNRRAALIYGFIAFFNAAAAYRAVYWLLTGWE